MATITPSPERIAEQHSYVSPALIDYISIRQVSKVERTYQAVAVLTSEGEDQYRTGAAEHDLRGVPFETSKEAREFCRAYYKGITVQTN